MVFLWNPVYGKTAGVFLVGLDPGDPDLATVKAIKLIEEADIIYSLSKDIRVRFAAHRCTMAIFTHRTDFAEIIRKLRIHYAPETPIAVVFHAGYKDKQNIVSGTLDTIESKIKPEALPHLPGSPGGWGPD